jgi:hypothetical protein
MCHACFVAGNNDSAWTALNAWVAVLVIGYVISEEQEEAGEIVDHLGHNKT